MSLWQVGEFWQGLEAATNARQRVLFHRINGHLAVLARAIEATVGELLSVRLEAVPIRMEPPSAQTFHASLQDLLSRGQWNSRSKSLFTIACKRCAVLVRPPTSMHYVFSIHVPGSRRL